MNLRLRACALMSFGVALSAFFAPTERGAPFFGASVRAAASCPREMARVANSCIDRWEVHTVDVKTTLPLSPFYPPDPVLLGKVYTFWSTEAARTGPPRARALPLPPVPEHQRGHFEPKAMSAPGVLPQGYMTYYSAKKSCENAGKRLCTEEEWVRACRGKRGAKHPYGENFLVGKCNIFRQIHPAYELHGNSSLGHLDPRLHLVVEGLDAPLLMETGQLPECVSEVREGTVYDMEGNLDEWIADEDGVFVGGFFSRQTTEGCQAKIEGHAPVYTDYSIGTRCCKSL